jgi:hypothetical protein
VSLGPPARAPPGGVTRAHPGPPAPCGRRHEAVGPRPARQIAGKLDQLDEKDMEKLKSVIGKIAEEKPEKLGIAPPKG